jgi:hypothetical protein
MLTDEEKRTQDDIREAYRWVMRVAEEAGALLIDGTKLLIGRGFENEEGLKSGFGVKVPPDAWPFVYFLARVYHPLEKGPSGASVFLAVVPYNPELDEGPRLFSGCIRWSGSVKKVDYWVVWSAAASPKEQERFKLSGDKVITSDPTEAGRSHYKGIEEVRWFSLPLAWVSSAERLERIVDAITDMAKGHDQRALTLVNEVL